jgi:hypothetical protein
MALEACLYMIPKTSLAASERQDYREFRRMSQIFGTSLSSCREPFSHAADLAMSGVRKSCSSAGTGRLLFAQALDAKEHGNFKKVNMLIFLCRPALLRPLLSPRHR